MSLPRVHVKASVVGSLAAVGAYVHLCADVIAGIGGVSIGYDEAGEFNPAALARAQQLLVSQQQPCVPANTRHVM